MLHNFCSWLGRVSLSGLDCSPNEIPLSSRDELSDGIEDRILVLSRASRPVRERNLLLTHTTVHDVQTAQPDTGVTSHTHG